MTFKPRVTVVEPGRRLEWLGTMGIPGLFDGRHSFTLTPLADGRTRSLAEVGRDPVGTLELRGGMITTFAPERWAARILLFSAAMAYQLGAGLVPVRKLGKLPAETITAGTAQAVPCTTVRREMPDFDGFVVS